MPPASLLKKCRDLGVDHRWRWAGEGYVPKGWRIQICERCGGHGKIEPNPGE